MGTRWAPARASIFQDWKQIPTPLGPGQSQFELFVSQITNYGNHMGTCITDWIVEARNKIWKSDPQKFRLLQEQANFNFHVFFDEKRVFGTTWAPARAAIFPDWKNIPIAPGTGQFQLS